MAGLRAGDLIVSLQGRIVRSVDDVHRLLSRPTADVSLVATVIRQTAAIGNRTFTDTVLTAHGRQEAGGRRQEAGGRRQETGDRRQETGDRRQEAGDRCSPPCLKGG